MFELNSTEKKGSSKCFLFVSKLQIDHREVLYVSNAYNEIQVSRDRTCQSANFFLFVSKITTCCLLYINWIIEATLFLFSYFSFDKDRTRLGEEVLCVQSVAGWVCCALLCSAGISPPPRGERG